MAYDGKLLRLAQQKFEADRDAREAKFLAEKEAIFDREPRLRAVDSCLRSQQRCPGVQDQHSNADCGNRHR